MQKNGSGKSQEQKCRTLQKSIWKVTVDCIFSNAENMVNKVNLEANFRYP